MNRLQIESRDRTPVLLTLILFALLMALGLLS